MLEKSTQVTNCWFSSSEDLTIVHLDSSESESSVNTFHFFNLIYQRADNNFKRIRFQIAAQGNQMSMYEHDVASTSVDYYLAERNIYESARLGTTLYTMNMFLPKPLPIYRFAGNRNYELSNHLGNVLAVINDLCYPLTNNIGDISSYEVGPLQVSDYCPFDGAYSVEAMGSTIELREQLQNYDNQWFDKGQYDVNVYRYDATVYHGSEIASIDTLVAYWARPSSSEVLEPLYNDSLLPRERVQIDYLDRDSCVMHGYVYELLDNSGSSIGWLPKDTLSWSPHLEYTVLTRDSTAPVANVDKQGIFNEEIMLYPNPTSNAHTLVVNGFEQKNLIVELFDIQGRRLETIYNGVAGKKQTFEINVSHLNSGMYFYSIKSEGIQKSIRFIKQ